MPDPQKTRTALLDSARDHSHRFADVVQFLQGIGWTMRTKGSHRIFKRPGVPVLLNLQPDKNDKAKAYQIRQVRQVFRQFNL